MITKTDTPAQSTTKEKHGRSLGTKILLGMIILVIVVLAAAVLTLNVTILSAEPDTSYSYTTMYGVSFPEGEPIIIGNIHIIVLTYNNEMVSDVDGSREKLVLGENRILSERRARITTLGIIPLVETNFQITLKYKGVRDNRAYFDMAVRTSKQVPEILIKQLLPKAIDARPI